MVGLAELEPEAMRLRQDQRAALAAHLLESLPGILHGHDAGVAEAIRRDV